MEIWPWNFASVLSFSFLETSFLFYLFFSDEAVYLLFFETSILMYCCTVDRYIQGSNPDLD